MNNDFLNSDVEIDEDVEDVEDVFRLPKRYIRNCENPIEFYEDIPFKKRYRFSKRAVVVILLPLIHNELQRNNHGLPISPLMQLLITLRFYATSSFQVYFILLPNLYILFIIYHIFYVLVFQIVSGDMR